MSDLAVLQHGRPPWEPSTGSKLVAEYQHYDVPLVGVIRQGDTEYLFVCLDGQDEMVSLWWFTAVSSEQRAQIEDADSPDEYERLLSAMPVDGWSRLALATQHNGIVEYVDVEGVAGGAAAALRELLARVDQLQTGAHELHLSHA